MKRLIFHLGMSSLSLVCVACSEEGGEPTGPRLSEPLPQIGLGNGEPPAVVVAPRMPSMPQMPAPSPLKVCEILGVPTVADLQRSWLLDDFEDGDSGAAQNGIRGWWYSFGDESAGTQTPDPWETSAGGPGESTQALHVTGGGYTEWGSVNAISLATEGEGADCLFDGSVYDGVSFWVRGSIQMDSGAEEVVGEADREVLKVQFHELRTLPLEAGGSCDPLEGPCWNPYRARIPLTDCWTRHAVRFEEMVQDDWGQQFGELDPSQLHQFALEVTRLHTYDYWIDDIEFFAGESPATERACEGDGGGGAGGATSDNLEDAR